MWELIMEGWKMIELEGVGLANFFLADLKLFEYFVDSNFAGKVVIAVLVVMNCYALTLMWTKQSVLQSVFVFLAGIFKVDEVLTTSQSVSKSLAPLITGEYSKNEPACHW